MKNTILTLRYFGICIFFSGFTSLTAQHIDTKSIDVTKIYSPEIATITKERETAPAQDSLLSQRKTVRYTFFSVPVASTFIPEKGKVTRLSPENQRTYNNSYVALGGGNYTTLWGDALLILPRDNRQTITLDLQHLSSLGGITGVNGKDAFTRTALGGSYSKEEQNFQWNGGFRTQHRLFHWYGGIPQSTSDNTNDFTSLHNFIDAELFGGLKTKGFLKNLKVRSHFLIDNFYSTEYAVKAQPQFTFPLSESYGINIDVNAEIIKSHFKNDLISDNALSFLQGEFAVNPSFTLHTDQIQARIGGKLAFVSGSDSKFKLYPAVECAIPLIDRLVVLVTGASGGTQLNSYRSLSEVNPFLRPSVELHPSLNNYTAFVGARGIIDTGINYNATAFFGNTEQRAFFDGSNENPATLSSLNFPLQRSFKMIYDNISFWGVKGEFEGNIADELFFRVQAKYELFRTNLLSKVRYTPHLTAYAYADYKILPQWVIGSDIFFIGSRYGTDYQQDTSKETLQQLHHYFDINLHTQYTLNHKWSIILRANNILNKNYENWLYYPTQGLQLNLGIRYQFNNR